MKSPVAEIPAADSAAAVAHFGASFGFETDCWDVYVALSNGNKDFVLLDVRSPSDYERGHLPEAINLPHGKIIASKLVDWPADTLFVVYCGGPHCNGADRAALRLARLGRPVKRMTGGVTGWLDDGLELVCGPEAGAAPSSAKTQDLLNQLAEAWGTADPARVTALMTHDCVYEASVGPEPGRTFRGSKELVAGLKIMFAHDAAARVEITDVFTCGDRAAWEWRYFSPSGELIARGCDLFVIRDGRIAVKNAFRKTMVDEEVRPFPSASRHSAQPVSA